MKEFSESNAAGADLWRHLQNAAGQPVTDIMAQPRGRSRSEALS
jgi:hypothetical protein